MSQQLPDVEPMEDPGGGRAMPAHSMIAAVMELQSLVEWTAQRKGLKEDPSVVNEKLRQLDRIRKELERSARSMTPSSAETSHIHGSTDDIVKSEMDLSSSDLDIKFTQDSSDHIIVPFICDHQPVQDLTMDIDDFSVCAMDDSFHLDDIPPPVDEHSCDSALEESSTDLYINFVSAKEEIEKLTTDLETEEEAKSSDKVGTRHDTTEEPDSLGTAISEDEGLGEESRRADSTGSNSFLDIHTSEEDLIDSGAGASSVRFAKEDEPASKDDVVWINDPQDPRLSVELCRCTIYKLKECLKAKEEQLKRFRDEFKDNNQVKTLQTLVNNLKNETEELRNEIKELNSQLETSRREQSELHEQVLELEEAENDSRRQCQRYEEKVLFLQEKDAHFQAEFVETKQALEMCMNTLSVKEGKEKELRAQLKYMEVLVQKYEDQMKVLEVSESKIKQKADELEEQVLKLQKPDALNKGTQTYPERAKIEQEGHGSSKTSGDSCSCEKHCSTHRDKSRSRLKGSADKHSSHRDDASSRKNSIKSLPDVDMTDTSHFTEIGIQVDCSDFTEENGTQTEFEMQMCCESSCSTTGEIQTFSANSSITSAIELSGESASNTDLETTVSSSCPFQQELFRRLHHLVEEDAHLQQQLHHMDQINLTLWQKLHNLEFHIGECKKENFQHSEKIEDVSDTISPENIPPRESSLPLSLDPSEEEHYINSGKLINLDFNEEELKDRLLRLEKINCTFEAELRNREKLYQRKEQKHKEWIETEDRFTCDIRYLQMEKNSLLSKVAQLEAEKQRLTNKVLTMVDELSCLQERHKKQIALMTEEHEALVSELRSRIELLTRKEKEYVGQIANLRMEKKTTKKEVVTGEKGELENLKASYVQLQIELSQNRSNMEQMESEFEERLEELKKSHLVEEERLEEELKQLREKGVDFDEQVVTYQKRQSELEAALSDKEQQLEDARFEFKEQLLAMEEEHRTVEIELNRKLRQMEESTAVATKALTEEKMRLEKELQENICDLRTKEEQYKSRITELESNVSQLHVELRRLTGDLDAGFPESDGNEFPSFQKEKLQKQLQELQRREGDLREKLDEMEQKEAAYRETLENADRIVASVERGYKNKIEELEMSERSLKQRVKHLEEIESKLRVALHRERRSSDGRKPDDLVLELLEAEVRENTLKERIETLEQSQRSTTHRLKELEKMRESLESKMADHEELVTSLDRLQHEHDIARKEIAKLRISESGMRLGLQQAEGMLKNREIEMRNEMARMQEEKKELEETIHQLRMQVRQLQLLMDSNQDEDTDGETLSETVHKSEMPETSATPTEGETLESAEVQKTTQPTVEDQNVSDETTTKIEKIKSVTFQENDGTHTDQPDEQKPEPKNLPEQSEQDNSDKDSLADALLEPSDMITFSDSLDICEEGEDRLAPTIEFFLPEPKKSQYEMVETSMPELQPVQEITCPLTETEMPADETLNTDLLPTTDERVQNSEQVSTSAVEEGDKVSPSSTALEVASGPSEDGPHSEPAVINPGGATTDATDISGCDSKNISSAHTEDIKSPDSDCKETGGEDAQDVSDELSQQTCDIQLLNEELSNELSSEGSTAVPADSILRLLRGLRPSSASEGPPPSSGARAKVRSLLKRHVAPVNSSTVSVSQDSEKKDDLCADEDQVDWLKVAEESASRYEEEKKSLEDEVKRLREKATAIEKEKEVLQESLKKEKELENLRVVNVKLQEEVSLLQKRLKMSTCSDSAEAKKDDTRSPPDESSPKEEEVKRENKTDLTSKTSASSGFALASGEMKSPASPPPPPPIDECRKERMQLEENMIRAMVAMQFDMQQKKAAKRFSPAFGGDASTRPKVPVSQEDEVVAMGACSSETEENRSISSSSTVQSPYNFRVVQQVGSDTVLVGWEHAQPTELEGFEVYVNGTLHETVYTPDRTKAVISGLDMQQPLTLSVCAISRFGDVSEPQLLHLKQRDSISKDGFFFLDEDDDDYDDLFFVDEEIEKQTRPYSMEW